MKKTVILIGLVVWMKLSFSAEVPPQFEGFYDILATCFTKSGAQAKCPKISPYLTVFNSPSTILISMPKLDCSKPVYVFETNNFESTSSSLEAGAVPSTAFPDAEISLEFGSNGLTGWIRDATSSTDIRITGKARFTSYLPIKSGTLFKHYEIAGQYDGAMKDAFWFIPAIISLRVSAITKDFLADFYDKEKALHSRYLSAKFNDGTQVLTLISRASQNPYDWAKWMMVPNETADGRMKLEGYGLFSYCPRIRQTLDFTRIEN